MSILRKPISLFVVTAAVAAASLVPATAANAAAPKPKAGGWVAITITPGRVTPRAVQNVGGGTWSYGTTTIASSGGTRKQCYSNYVHNSKRHSSTAILADVQEKTYANAGSWSNASVVAGSKNTCYAYWNTY